MATTEELIAQLRATVQPPQQAQNQQEISTDDLISQLRATVQQPTQQPAQLPPAGDLLDIPEPQTLLQQQALRLGAQPGIAVTPEQEQQIALNQPIQATESELEGKEFRPLKGSTVQTKPPADLNDVNRALNRIPGAPALAEVAAAINRPILSIADIPFQIVNTILDMAGIQKEARIGSKQKKARLPTPTELLGSEGEFIEPGLLRDFLQTGGELIPSTVAVGQLFRQLATKLPAFFTGESFLTGLIRQLGQTTAAGDVALGALSGGGGEIGRQVIGGDVGELVGSIVAPTLGAVVGKPLTALLQRGGQAIGLLQKELTKLPPDGASTLLAEFMVREGIGPDDVIKRLRELGPDALPADTGVGFARLVRTASNKIPRIQGLAGQTFAERQKDQAKRILNSLDDQSGTSSLSLESEVARLDKIFTCCNSKTLCV